MAHITDMRDELQPESSGWLFKLPLARGGGILWGPTTGCTACFILSLEWDAKEVADTLGHFMFQIKPSFMV